MTTLKQRDDWLKALLASGEHETTKLIGVRLALYLNIASGRCDPSYGGIARDLGGHSKHRRRRGISKDTATRQIQLLEAHGWISIARVVGRSRTNSFTLLLPPEKAASPYG